MVDKQRLLSTRGRPEGRQRPAADPARLQPRPAACSRVRAAPGKEPALPAPILPAETPQHGWISCPGRSSQPWLSRCCCQQANDAEQPTRVVPRETLLTQNACTRVVTGQDAVPAGALSTPRDGVRTARIRAPRGNCRSPRNQERGIQV